VKIRVLIADDQSMVRAGFRMLLSGEEDIEVVAEARDGLEAVAKAAQLDPTVILMDIRMPELDGLEATRRIIAAHDAARILILTTFGLDEYVYEALRAGASGFVLKDDPPEQLIGAVRTVAAGDALLSPAITKRVIKQFTRIPVPRLRKSWTSSPHESTTSSGSSPKACPTWRSGRSSTSAKRPSRHTSRTSSRNSASATASRPSCSLIRRGLPRH
jgi:DNA-binding NarL/FixJ family response regulator